MLLFKKIPLFSQAKKRNFYVYSKFRERKRNHFFALAAISFASWDFFLLALFLWIVPPLTALSSREEISEQTFIESLRSADLTVSLYFFSAVVMERLQALCLMRANSLILTLFTADFVWGIEFNLSFLDSELICLERAEIRVTGSKMAH
jgi:hypothetical protein